MSVAVSPWATWKSGHTPGRSQPPFAMRMSNHEAKVEPHPDGHREADFTDLGCGGATPCRWAWPFGQAEPPVTPEHVHLGDRCAWFTTLLACERACEAHNGPGAS